MGYWNWRCGATGVIGRKRRKKKHEHIVHFNKMTDDRIKFEWSKTPTYVD